MTTEKELIERACGGDSAAFLPLYKKYRPIVFKKQGMYRLKDLESDDWQQEGQLVFFKTIQRYDASRGVSLGIFFRINFERHIFSLLRHQSAEKRKIDFNASSLEGQLEEQGDYFFCRGGYQEDVAFGYVELRESLAGFNERLSPLEQKVFHCYLAGQSTRQISQELNIAESKVSNAMDRVKSKFKNALK